MDDDLAAPDAANSPTPSGIFTPKAANLMASSQNEEMIWNKRYD